MRSTLTRAISGALISFFAALAAAQAEPAPPPAAVIGTAKPMPINTSWSVGLRIAATIPTT